MNNKIIANQLAMLPGFENHHPLVHPEQGTGMLNSLYELQQAVAEDCDYDSIHFSSGGIDTALFSIIAMIKAWHQQSKAAKPEFVLIGNAAQFDLVHRQIDFDLLASPQAINSIDRAWARFNCGDNTAAVFLTPTVDVDVSVADVRWIADRVHYCGGLIVADSNICRLLKQSGIAADEIVDIYLLDLFRLFGLSATANGIECFALAACEQLSAFLPVPRLVLDDSLIRWSSDDEYPLSVGRTSAFGASNFALLSLAIELQLHGNSLGTDDI